MDRPPRLTAILPLKIMVISDGHTYWAHTLDISTSGAKIVLPEALDPGSDIELEYKKKRIRAQVVWSKPMKKGSSDHVLGIRLLDDGQRFWLVNLTPEAQILESAGRSDAARLPATTRDRSSV